MPFVRKCQQCGLDLTDPSATVCPMCGSALSTASRKPIWFIAAFQICLASGFMLLFHFPKWMIAAFAGMILVGTLAGSFIKPRNPNAPRTLLPKPTRPTLFGFVGLGMFLCVFASLCFLLLGFVMFINNWNDWHRYERQPYQVTTFQVTQVFYQKHSKSIDLYASGIVNGQREWMSLEPFLPPAGRPRSQAQLEEAVPAGTSIPIYLFPEMKGRSRVRVYSDIPPAEAYHRTAIKTAKYAPMGLAISIGLLFILTRVQRLCFSEATNAVAASAS